VSTAKTTRAADLWYCRPEELPAHKLEQKFLEWLTPSERAHRQKLRTATMRHDYLATRALCRLALSHSTGVDPATWVFTAGKFGKPAIARPPAFRPVRFNLSHTDGLIVCAVSRAGEIGIDVEETSREVDIAQISRHFFSADEQGHLSTLSAKERKRRFFQLWVLKEAYLKGRGIGLSKALDEVSIQWERKGKPLSIGNWQLALHRPTARHIAATAMRQRRHASTIPLRWRDGHQLFETHIPIEC
jgi:4'-phosphopantetheinyl transferase